MILCNEDCIPCCDFCIHKINGNLEVDGTDGPIGCKLHEDKKIKSIKKSQNGADIVMIFIALGQKIKRGQNPSFLYLHINPPFIQFNHIINISILFFGLDTLKRR